MPCSLSSRSDVPTAGLPGGAGRPHGRAGGRLVIGQVFQPHALGHAPTAPLSSEAAGGFTGVYFAMFATTIDGIPMPPADFDWFEYAPIEE